jgi:hypothetical protein
MSLAAHGHPVARFVAIVLVLLAWVALATLVHG